MNKQVKTTLILITLIGLIATFAGTAKAPPPSEYEITLAQGFPVYDPQTNTQNWTYNIHCVTGQDVSHINFEFDQICDPPLSVIKDAGPGEIRISNSYTDYIPGTTMAGIKIDVDVTPGETKQIWFTLEGEWPVGTITVYVKSGQQDLYDFQYEVAGPECKVDNGVPEIPLGPIFAVASMMAAFGAYVKIRKPKVV
ncbi:MAG: hypothetical protein WC325_13125 [Candidatus Bathyarchaeia archaeon]|jgi:hypothetical protein